MASPFEIVIGRLRDLGFFEFLLPFLLTSAIFYGLLRRSQIFGPPERNVAVNAVVALVAAFMVWAYPVLIGVNVETQLSQFFFSGMVILLTVMVFLLGISMVPIEGGLAKFLEQKFKGGLFFTFIIVGIILSIGIVISSGLTNVFFPQNIVGGISQDIILTIIVVVLMAVTVIGLASLGAEAPKGS